MRTHEYGHNFRCYLNTFEKVDIHKINLAVQRFIRNVKIDIA